MTERCWLVVAISLALGAIANGVLLIIALGTARWADAVDLGGHTYMCGVFAVAIWQTRAK